MLWNAVSLACLGLLAVITYFAKSPTGLFFSTLQNDERSVERRWQMINIG